MSWLRTTGLRLLLAIGLGFALWVFVSFTENPEQTSSFAEVPVEIEGIAPDLVRVDEQGLPRENRPTVDITIEGDEATVQRVQPGELRAFVDLEGLGPGEHANVPVSVVPNRQGLQRLNFTADPAFLSFRLEQVITRTVPLTDVILGDVPFSFEQEPARLTAQGQPINSVEIRGPQSRVERVTIARVTASVGGLTANYSSPRPVEPLAEDGEVVEGVTVTPTSVNVLVPIVSSAGIKRVPIVPNVVGSPASGYIVTGVSVEPQFVRLAGSAGPLDTIQSVGTADITIEGARGTITRTVELRPQSNTSLASGEPNTATVRVQIAPIAGAFQITLPVPVQVVDQPDGLLVSISPQVVQLTLAGDAARLGSINPGDLVGIVSMSDAAPGSYTREPVFQLPAGISVVGTPPRVTVTLRAPPTAEPPTPTEETPEPPASETPAAETPTEPAPTAAPETPAATPVTTPTP
jgi:YbbR domain-containing protein